MRSGADHRIRNRTRFTTLRMGLDGKVVASGFHLFDLGQVISIVDLILGNRSVANDVENVLRTDRVVSPGLLNVILLVELGRPPDLSPARSPAAKSCCGAVAPRIISRPRPHASILPKRRILAVIGSRRLPAGD